LKDTILLGTERSSVEAKRMQAGHGNIVFDIPVQLVGVPPSPRPPACTSGRTRLSAWLCAPCGRFLLHIRAGEGRRKMRRWQIAL